jgi:hypothetical protein
MSAYKKVKEYTNEELREIYNDYHNNLNSDAPALNMTDKLTELYIADGGENYCWGLTNINVNYALLFEIADRFRLGQL